MVAWAQAAVDGDGEIALDAEVDSLAGNAAGPAADGLDDRGRGSDAEALGDGQIGQDQVVRACYRHRLHCGGLSASTPADFSGRIPDQTDLKHFFFFSLSLYREP